MATDYEQLVSHVLTTPWNVRAGVVVPEHKDVVLTGGAVRLDLTILYADLADSTRMATNYDKRVVAKLYRSFLASCSQLIRDNGGHIRSFDGDRVMGIWIGNWKNTPAVRCALQINYVLTQIISPRFAQAFPTFAGQYPIAHAAGVDTSDILAVRAGVRGDNDLVWVGKCANVAAKLSTLRESPYHSFITSAVYSKLHASAKVSQSGLAMWEARHVDGIGTIYRSNWRWKPS